MRAIGEILRDTASRLQGMSDTPYMDAEILMAHAMKIRRSKLMSMLRKQVEPEHFEEYVLRRLDSEPIAYIVGEWEFFSLNFLVEPPLLVPRPETEHLVEAVLGAIKGLKEPHVLEIGVGTGCVSLAIARNNRNCKIVATDINQEALDLAKRNTERHSALTRLTFRLGNVFEALTPKDGPFDVICSNPPYVEQAAWPKLAPTIRNYEDPKALLAGEDGLDIIRILIAQTQAHLRPKGMLAFEIGENQSDAVRGLLSENNFKKISFKKDLAGFKRIAIGFKSA